jgi:hypothetical protein
VRTLSLLFLVAVLSGPAATSAQLVPDFTVQSATAQEGDPLVFTIRLERPHFASIILAFQTQSGTATGVTACSPSTPGDYVISGQSLELKAGELIKRVSVTTCEDSTPESAERLPIGVQRTSPGPIVSRSTVGTIDDDDGAPPPSISIANGFDLEGPLNQNHSLSLPVTLSAPLGHDVVVPVTVRADLANAAKPGTSCEAGVDYVVPPPITVRAAGNSFLSVKICGDDVPEPNEVATIVLTPVSELRFATPVVTVEIRTDDGLTIPPRP